MMERCKKRAENRKRSDDTEEILKKRVSNYED
jgi:adenylate kinase family enzyme